MKRPPPIQQPDYSQASVVEEQGIALPGFSGHFFRRTHSLGAFYRMPPPVLMIHALALASAMGRGFVSSAEAGPALLPLLVRCPETPPPDWMGDEWVKLQSLDDLCHTPSILDHPQRRAFMRRRGRIRALIDPDGMLPDISDNFKSRRLRFGRLVATHGTRKLACAGGSLPLTHLCSSLPRVSAVLGRLSGRPPNETLIGCVDEREFQQLVRIQGRLLVDRVGLVLPVPRMRQVTLRNTRFPMLSGMLVENFLTRRQELPPFVFNPEDGIVDMLGDHIKGRQDAVAKLPEVIRPLLPVPARVWHMAALLASLSHPLLRDQIWAAAHLAMYLDNWAVARHLRLIRLHFPADHQGWFEDTDLAVFRQLGQSPQTLREIQRRLRGVRKEACLTSLGRAIAAGLAVELPGPHYQLVPEPSDEPPDLSEKDQQSPVSPESGDRFFEQNH